MSPEEDKLRGPAEVLMLRCSGPVCTQRSENMVAVTNKMQENGLIASQTFRYRKSYGVIKMDRI